MEDEIVRMHLDGQSKRKIAKALNISKDKVTYTLLHNGYYNHMKFEINEDINDQIVELYTNELMSIDNISKFIKISRNNVAYVLCVNNISFGKGIKNRSKYKLNEKFFDNIDTEYKAYILGFLYADGYNNESKGRIEIVLKYEDEDILKKINNAIEGNFPIKDKIINGDSYKALRIYSKHMSKQLSSLGCFQNKSLLISKPNIESELISHFIRGYFDGDGHIGRYKNKKGHNQTNFSITSGSKDMLLFLKETFELEGIKMNFNIRNRKYISISAYGQKRINKIRDYLYRNATIYLYRKYKTFYNLPS